jgi:hypothetical protein
VPLPAVLDECRILGFACSHFAVEAYHRDDLVLLVWVQRNQREAVDAIYTSQMLSHMIG